jgi:hypothetical protein
VACYEQPTFLGYHVADAAREAAGRERAGRAAPDLEDLGPISQPPSLCSARIPPADRVDSLGWVQVTGGPGRFGFFAL